MCGTIGTENEDKNKAKRNRNETNRNQHETKQNENVTKTKRNETTENVHFGSTTLVVDVNSTN